MHSENCHPDRKRKKKTLVQISYLIQVRGRNFSLSNVLDERVAKIQSEICGKELSIKGKRKFCVCNEIEKAQKEK